MTTRASVPFAFSFAAALAAVALALFVLSGCGGGGRSGFDGSVYRNGRVAFQVGALPAGWRAVKVDGASLAYRDDAHEASVLLNARCGKADDGTPLVALTNQLIIGSTEREIVSQATVPFDHREAMHTTLKAKWDGVPMELDVFVMKKDGCTYDFVYLSAPSGFGPGAGDFERFVSGFRTLGSGALSS